MSVFRKFSERRKSKRQSQISDSGLQQKLAPVQESVRKALNDTTNNEPKDESQNAITKSTNSQPVEPTESQPQPSTNGTADEDVKQTNDSQPIEQTDPEPKPSIKDTIEETVGQAETTQPSDRAEAGVDASTDAMIEEQANQSRITHPNEKSDETVGNATAKTGTVASSLQKSSLMSKVTNYNPIGNIELPPQEEDHFDKSATREEVEHTFEQYAKMIHASNDPLPTQTGEGAYLKRDEPTGLMADIRHLGFKDLNTVRRIMEQKASGEPQNDREYLMESVMQLVAALPERSKNRVELTSMFLDELWNSLQHPPLSYMGDDFKYRSADGTRNNYTLPALGAANTPYARSVNPRTVTPGARPDPFLIFDSLMSRQEFKENPNRVSSVFFNWASIVIHDLFQTDHHDPSMSKTSSYLDLSVLYGDNQEDQNLMRTFKDGKIKPDCFAEQRLLAFPPSAGVMIILMNRWHNYVVEQMALINENGRFTKPSDDLPEPRKKAAWKKYDEDLFQTGRLVTCSLYINITLYDYLRTIVNLNRVNSTWTLDPRLEKPKNFAMDGTPRGVGNQVSAEFALCYRWHAAIGELDEAWTEEVYLELFGKKPEEVDMKELMIGLAKYDHELPDDPLERPFAHLKRGPDGKFNDDDLASIMINTIEQVSGAFDARNTPKSMRAVTVLGILQARQWNLCTLNEFRQFFGLKRFETFEEINSDPYVAEQLKNLYEHPDYVELYPGIAIEEAKTPMVPGVGICPNHTLARAVLSDAVALVRGDRFYTLDYSPKNLTQWGFNESNYDLNVNQGCVFYKLLLQALPNHFHPNSIYAHYPMTVPDENAKIMKDLGRFYDYNWDKPRYKEPGLNLTTYKNGKSLIAKSKEFTITWDSGHGYSMGNAHLGSNFGSSTGDKDLHHLITSFYEHVTLQLIANNTVKIAGINQVDIVRDVSNMAHTQFAANLFALPLKAEPNSKGVFTDHELWMALCVILTAVFFDFEPSKSYPLQQVSHKLATMLGALVESNIKATMTHVKSYTSMFFSHGEDKKNPLAEYSANLIHQLSEAGTSTHDMTLSQFLPSAIAYVPSQSQTFAQVLDFYLGEGKSHWPEIERLAATESVENDEKLSRYVHEAIRLNGTPGCYRLAEVEHIFEEDGKQIHVKPGDKVFCSFVGAARDSATFQNPNEVVLDRPLDSYIHYGLSDNAFIPKQAGQLGLVAMLRTVAKLPGVRRAPGEQGQLKKVARPDGSYTYMTQRHDSYFVFPTTMKIHYDGFIPDPPPPMTEQQVHVQ